VTLLQQPQKVLAQAAPPDCNLLELTESKAKQLYFQDRSFGFAALQLEGRQNERN
jgi:hypothetical protein